jgi:hypothetical protein
MRKKRAVCARSSRMRKSIVVLVVVGSIACRRDRGSPAISSDPTPSASAMSTPKSKPAVKQSKLESKGDFTTTLEWPVIDLPSGVGSVITKTIEDDLRTGAKASEDDYRNALKADGADASSDPFLEGWFVDSVCDAALVSYEFVSVLCEDATYSGGAHEMAGASSYAWSIDAAGAHRVKIADVVGAARTSKLEEVLHGELKKRGAAFVVDGTVAPKDLFYQDDGPFAVDRDGITFVFSPYVVGPWSDGEWRQHLDWATLRSIAADPKVIARMESAAHEPDAIVANVFPDDDDAGAP